MLYRYSPFDISEYEIKTVERCEVKGIQKLEPRKRAAVWNLAWLSLPSLDALLIHGKSPNWHKHYLPTPGASRVITSDAISDHALFLKLQLHPLVFLSFFERQDHSAYFSYDVMGGEEWVKTVTCRARESAAHMASTLPADIRNNVYAFSQKGAM